MTFLLAFLGHSQTWVWSRNFTGFKIIVLCYVNNVSPLHRQFCGIQMIYRYGKKKPCFFFLTHTLRVLIIFQTMSICFLRSGISNFAMPWKSNHTGNRKQTRFALTTAATHKQTNKKGWADFTEAAPSPSFSPAPQHAWNEQVLTFYCVFYSVLPYNTNLWDLRKPL